MDDDSWFFNGNFNGVPENFFDDVFKSDDLPLEGVESNEDWNADFQGLEPPADVFSHSFSGQVINNNNLKPTNNHSDFSDGTSQLKQTSATDKTLISGSTLTHEVSANCKGPGLFQTHSPISFLESSGSCSAENSSEFCPKFLIHVKRTRSKRPRPPFFNPQRSFPFMISESDSENLIQGKPKRKRNLTRFSSSAEDEDGWPHQPNRKCSHCETTETPQWRFGPMGPKTLCNACGVRYRSGRLLPEYRPAGSPGFIPSLHSNSHRKVIELRKNACRSSN
ncbi:hypothetical protein ACFE04_012521 [Oxalis oulophora]